MKIAALILAAGMSSRMGTAKQLLPYKHTTLLGWTIENAVKSEVNAVYCILGANAEEIASNISKYNVETIHNQDYQKGLSSSIISGIKHIKTLDYDAVFIMLCDQPGVNDMYINALVSKFKSKPNHIIASRYKNIKGVPAIFPKEQFSNLLNLKDDKGAKLLLNTSNKLVTTVETPIDLFDIDTPNDYKDFIK